MTIRIRHQSSTDLELPPEHAATLKGHVSAVTAQALMPVCVEDGS